MTEITRPAAAHGPAGRRFQFGSLAAVTESPGVAWLEFLHKPSMSLGLYVLEAGATDPQQPHDRDEVYHIVAGKGRFTCGAEDTAIGAGAVLYVPAGVVHRFHDIEEDLRMLVVFAGGPVSGSDSQ